VSLSIETLGGIASPMIEAQQYHSDEEEPKSSLRIGHADEVEVVVTQGERPMARDNKLWATSA